MTVWSYTIIIKTSLGTNDREEERSQGRWSDKQMKRWPRKSKPNPSLSTLPSPVCGGSKSISDDITTIPYMGIERFDL